MLPRPHAKAERAAYKDSRSHIKSKEEEERIISFIVRQTGSASSNSLTNVASGVRTVRSRGWRTVSQEVKSLTCKAAANRIRRK